VLVDISNDVQRAFIDEESLRSFDPPLVKNTRVYRSANESIDQLLHHIERSKRPIIIAGWGVHLSKTVEKFRRFVAQAQIPVALTWGGADLLDCNNKYRVGTFGTHGQRHANFAVQNSDFVLSLGSRLDTKSTGSPITSFARGAWKAVVDIDVYELGKFEKFGLQIDCLIEDTLDNAINLLLERGFSGGNSDDWMKKLSGWKNKFTQFDRPKVSSDYVNPYVFMDKLSEVCPPETQLVIDTGCTVAWAMQALNPRDTTRLFHDFNNTAMGWALPASIGISLADKSRLVFCLVGDGSLMMNLQELATVCGYQIPIKIICFNNDGYSMIKQTQDQWLGSQYLASSEEGGVFFPNLSEIAQAFGLDIYNIRSDKEIEPILKSVVDTSAPTFCNVCVDPGIRVSPQVKFGRPNEDPEPLLPRDIFLREMIVDPQEKSEDSV
jgi:acetolactate synthase I/II/III large subunit